MYVIMIFQQQIMQTNVNKKNLFNQTKTDILENKFQYLKIYLNDAQRRVDSIQMENLQLANQVKQLKQNNKILIQLNQSKQEDNQINSQYDHLCIERITLFKQEEKDKLKSIEELKKLIDQYKHLCEETMKLKNFNYNFSVNFSHSPVVGKAHKQAVRENSFFNVTENIENENTENIDNSMMRNKSYQKIKTKIYCENCGVDYKPNQYYRHLYLCQRQLIEGNNTSEGERQIISTNRTLR